MTCLGLDAVLACRSANAIDSERGGRSPNFQSYEFVGSLPTCPKQFDQGPLGFISLRSD
jgi:hypothetical protein